MCKGEVIRCGDITQAFLRANILTADNSEVYMRMPVDCREFEENTGEELYWKLNKSIYGMPTSSLAFEKLMVDFLVNKCNLKRSTVDPYVFYGKDVRLLLWVDDVCIRG